MKQKNTRRVPQSKGAPVPVDAPAASVPPIASAAGGRPCDSESDWVRLPRPGCSLRGLSRSFLFQLCKAGTVESIVIQGPRKIGERKSARGIRLILLASLDGFLAEKRKEQAAGRALARAETKLAAGCDGTGSIEADAHGT